MAAADNRSLIELPELVFEGTLFKLPCPSLLVCCCVSKSLFNLIKNDPGFAKMHFENSKPLLLLHSFSFQSFNMLDLDTKTTSPSEMKPNFNFPFINFTITCSSNGLLLLEIYTMDTSYHHFIVFNPVTGEYTTLPDSVKPYTDVLSAFFYSPKSKQLKVLRLVHPVKADSEDGSCYSFMEVNESPNLDLDSNHDEQSVASSDPDQDSPHSDVELNLVSDTDSYDSDLYFDSDSTSSYDTNGYFVLGELFVGGLDLWESLGDLPFYPHTLFSRCHMGNTTHWLCSDDDIPNPIVLFNFETHQFGEISGPAHLDRRSYKNGSNAITLFVLDNCLAIFDCLTVESNICIWRLNDDNCWTRDFVIDKTTWGVNDMYYDFTPLMCKTNGELVMVSEGGYIIFYDLLKKSGRIVHHPAILSSSTLMLHTPSFVSLRDATEGSNLRVMNVGPRFVESETTPV